MKGIQPATIEFHTRIEKHDRSDSFAISVIPSLSKFSCPFIFLRIEGGLKLDDLSLEPGYLPL
jgi:hypothetical protein